jgi:hypothetical protein
VCFVVSDTLRPNATLFDRRAAVKASCEIFFATGGAGIADRQQATQRGENLVERKWGNEDRAQRSSGVRTATINIQTRTHAHLRARERMK